MYLIKFETCQQVSPDDFRMEWKEKLFDENTTIKDIHDWMLKSFRMGDKENTIFPEMRLTRPEK